MVVKKYITNANKKDIKGSKSIIGYRLSLYFFSNRKKIHG